MITNPDPEPDNILDSPHLSQRQKESALVEWMFAKLEQNKLEIKESDSNA